MVRKEALLFEPVRNSMHRPADTGSEAHAAPLQSLPQAVAPAASPPTAAVREEEAAAAQQSSTMVPAVAWALQHSLLAVSSEAGMRRDACYLSWSPSEPQNMFAAEGASVLEAVLAAAPPY